MFYQNGLKNQEKRFEGNMAFNRLSTIVFLLGSSKRRLKDQ